MEEFLRASKIKGNEIVIRLPEKCLTRRDTSGSG